MAFTCPFCLRVSHHPHDQAERFCGVCGFVDDVAMQGAALDRARAAYRDDSFSERNCDACGQPYRGPAVHCSLTCALGDA